VWVLEEGKKSEGGGGCATPSLTLLLKKCHLSSRMQRSEVRDLLPAPRAVSGDGEGRGGRRGDVARTLRRTGRERFYLFIPFIGAPAPFIILSVFVFIGTFAPSCLRAFALSCGRAAPITNRRERVGDVAWTLHRTGENLDGFFMKICTMDIPLKKRFQKNQRDKF